MIDSFAMQITSRMESLLSISEPVRHAAAQTRHEQTLSRTWSCVANAYIAAITAQVGARNVQSA